jgi:transcriptional regulator with XRE-family HTH domain
MGGMNGWAGYVRAVRRTHGLKQIALAEKLGVTQQLVSAWERGVLEPPPRMRRRLLELMRQERSLEDELLLNLVRRSHAMQLVGPEAFVLEAGTKPVELAGTPREAIIGRPWRDQLGEDFKQLTDRIDQSGIYDGRVASLTYIGRFLWQGQTRELVIFSTPLVLHGGRPVRAAIYHRAMTPDEFRRRYPGKELVIETFEDIEDVPPNFRDWKLFEILPPGLTLLGWL